MAINIQYGPIAKALGLAQVAGQGQGFNIQSQRDLQALGLQNQMQNSINSNNANLIQMSMARDEAQARQAVQQQQMQQQQVQQQAQQEAAAAAQKQNDQRFAQQQATQTTEFNRQQQTREDQAKAIADVKAQSIKEKQVRDAWLQTLTPEQQNAVLSGAGLPMAKPPAEISPTAVSSDQRIREQSLVDLAKTKWERDKQSEDKIRSQLVPDPDAVKRAEAQTANSYGEYVSKAQNFATGPANVAGLTAAPTKDQVAPATQPTGPTGPGASPPGGLFGTRARMPDGSMWKWDGVQWNKI